MNEIDIALEGINYIGLHQQILNMLEDHKMLIGNAKDPGFNDSQLVEKLIKLIISGGKQ